MTWGESLLFSVTRAKSILARVWREIYSPWSAQALVKKWLLALLAFLMDGVRDFMVLWTWLSGRLEVMIPEVLHFP